jgi:NAD(P)-dependent dehydrogenase (short-subunit alcohol dehydrogenase family)
MAMRLQDKVAIITGGASGIGAATARRFLDEGAEVAIADLKPPADPRAGLFFQEVDTSDEASVARLVAAVVARHGRLDVMVNSAGISHNLPFLDTPVADLDRILAVNLRGTFLMGQSAARAMIAGGRGGAIVNVASVAGMRGNVLRSAYGASKGGVVTLGQVMAVELAGAGIRVNTIAPGPIETPLATATHDDAYRRIWTDRIPMRRFGMAEEIAAAAVYLACDESAYVTGHTLVVDGGFMAGGLLPA